MTIHLNSLENAYLAVEDDPLARAWIHRDSSAIRIVSDLMDAGASPSPADRDWVEVPTPDELNLKSVLMELFVHQVCPHLALPVYRCFGRQDAWRSYKELLDQQGYLEDWQRFEERSLRNALRHWADDHAIEVASA